VTCSVWFQEDLPFPGVDLSKLKPKTEDLLPSDLRDLIVEKKFEDIYWEILELNFMEEIDINEKLFDHLYVDD